MKLPPHLAERIEAEIANLTPESIGHINYEGLRYQGLPVMGTIGEVWLLRSDGSFWKVDSDFGLPLTPLPENLHTMAVVYGTERYPWLADLLPTRPAGATDCSHCHGRGRLGPAGEVGCYACGALGWVAGGNQQAPAS